MTRETYLQSVYPQVSDAVRQKTLHIYDSVRLIPEAGFVPLSECDVVMLVGLTGTGKSTTLKALTSQNLTYTSAIPSRRELTDLIIIPYAQVVGRGDPVQPVRDREARFSHTRTFRELIAGGAAAAFSWLYVNQPDALYLSEGVRGANEIQYALDHTRWRIVELWVDPITRLQRLSERKEAAFIVENADAAELSFLPESRRDEVRAGLASGDIAAEAVTTVRAESLNYGGEPFNGDHPRYTCLHIDNLTPDEVAAAVAHFVRS